MHLTNAFSYSFEFVKCFEVIILAHMNKVFIFGHIPVVCTEKRNSQDLVIHCVKCISGTMIIWRQLSAGFHSLTVPPIPICRVCSLRRAPTPGGHRLIC